MHMAFKTGVATLNCETTANISVTHISKEIAHTARWCSSEMTDRTNEMNYET